MAGYGDNWVNFGAYIDTRADGSIIGHGSIFDDVIQGTFLGDDIDGDGGNDSLFGLDGRDTLNGGDGDDDIEGGDDEDTIDGGAGNDTIHGDAGDDDIVGGAGDDTIRGDDGDDSINSGSGNDWVDGGIGNDTILDLLGVDTIYAGGGNDKVTVAGGDYFGFDMVFGGSGNDHIIATGSKVAVEGGSGSDTIETDLSRNTVLVGGEGSDRFVVTGVGSGSGRAAEIQGGGADYLIAGTIEAIDHVTAGADTSIDTLDLSQLSSAYNLTTHLGFGTMRGTDGTLVATVRGIENFVGGAGRDIVTGSAVANDIQGGAGNDQINGADGADLLRGDAGDDTMLGGTGDDALYGGDDVDTMNGDAGNDIVMGDAGNDTVNGGAGNDVVVGGAGADKLNGGSGTDVLYGDFHGDAVGADTLTGGADADRFVFVDVAKTSGVTIAGVTTKQTSIADRITDFDLSGTDRDLLDLSFLVNGKTNFTGDGAQQAIDAGYIFFLQHGTPGQAGFGTTVMLDLNRNVGGHGDTSNVFAVVDLDGVAQANLRADHFLV